MPYSIVTLKFVSYIFARIVVEKNLIIDQNEKISETFNDFFIKAISNFSIPQFEDLFMKFEQIECPILWIIKQYKNHLSISGINAKLMGKQFSLQFFQNQKLKRKF